MPNKLITIDNSLVKFSYELSLVEKRLLLLFIANINNEIIFKKPGENITEDEILVKSHDEEIRSRIIDSYNLEVIDPETIYYIHTEDYADLYGINRKSAREELKKALDSIYNRTISFKGVLTSDGKEVMVKTSWISAMATWENAPNTFGISWSKWVIPLISQLKANFTTYRVKWIVPLAYYAIRWYEIIVMELNKHHGRHQQLYFSINDVKRMYCLENRYSTWNDLKKRVLDSPFEEINKKTDVNVNFRDDGCGKIKYHKEGKKIIGFWLEVGRKDREELRKVGLV